MFPRFIVPLSSILPNNVSLEAFDAFGEIPDELVGKFDVVHIRFLLNVVKRNDPEPLLKNLIKMLCE